MTNIFQYRKLDASRKEIRLLQLLPGLQEDPIRLRIFHTTLDLKPAPKMTRLSREEIHASLPAGWKALETLEGRILFSYTDPNDSTLGCTSWSHPSPEFDRAKYEGPTEVPSAEPKFEALSYTWGSSTTPETATIISATRGEPESILHIGSNLASAFRDLRLPNAERTLWVDAVCINQKDTQERDEQVARMGVIYQYAYRVVVYLGLQSVDSDLALKTLEYLGKQLESTKNRQRTPSPTCTEPMWFHSRTELPYDDDTWDALVNIFQRPWFDRLWVMQEIQLANIRAVFVCGRTAASWYHIRRAMLCLNNKVVHPSPLLRARLRFMETTAVNTVGSSFPGLLSKAKVRQCSNPKDRIYAILGLLPPKLASRIIPSYSSSLQTIYSGAMIEYLKITQRLDLLEPCDIEERMQGLPTWVPNWSAPAKILSLSAFAFAVSGMSRAHWQISQQTNTLSVEGVCFAKVGKLSPMTMDGLQGVLGSIREFGLERLKTGLYPTGVSMREALAWVVSFGQVRDRKTSVSYASVAEWKEMLMTTPFEHFGPQSSPKTTYFDMMVDHAKGRRLIATEEGYLAIISKAGLPGDQICIILGCPVPILLRPLGTGQFEVVGPCYVHGAMDAEALLGPLPKPWTIQPVLNPRGLWEERYLNVETNEAVEDDPRLEPVPLDWEKLPVERTPDDPILLRRFRNRVSGEIINSDPRLYPDALARRGVALQNFDLV